MNRRHVPVTLPRARFDIDPAGHLAVSVDGQPWQPPTDDPTKPTLGAVRLGRSDVAWAQQQIADDLGTPVLVEIVDGGQAYSDVVDPDGYQVTDPGGPETPAKADVGQYRPGEPVVISVIVGRTRADEHGYVRYRLPAALGDRAVLVHGETSGTTLPPEQSPLPQWPTDAAKPPSPRPSLGRKVDARQRQAGSGHSSLPARPAPARRDLPDAGVAL